MNKRKQQQRKLRTKMELTPGKSLRGWGRINEYGEFSFRATQPGSATRSALKRITGAETEEARCSISASRDLCCIRLTTLKGDHRAMEQALREIFNVAINKLNEYDIED